MKQLVIITIVLFCVIINVTAQTTKSAIIESVTKAPTIIKKERYNIVLLSPLFLDSFDVVKNPLGIPTYAAPGIDFYKGAIIAADTLNKIGVAIDMHVYDTKSRFINLERLIETKKLDSADCIIGDVGGTDIALIANFCKLKGISFISAVSPADGDQNMNPYFTMLQPKLSSHIERIKKHIAQKYNTSNIVFLNRDNSAETNAYNYFKNAKTDVAIAGIKHAVINSNSLEPKDLDVLLKKDKENIIILSILDPKAAYDNLKVINNYSKLGITIKVFGMPTWENIKALKDAEEFAGTDVYFTSPALLEKSNTTAQYIAAKYKEKMGTNATDIVYKGFDAVFYFSKLMQNSGVPFTINIGNANNETFLNPYRIAPVMVGEQFKYYENKFLYLAHYLDGALNYE
jgi:ABC-type branched-subunit amino acid transport system substrate-binding protein